MADQAPDPLEEQLRKIRAEKQAKFEADKAAQATQQKPQQAEGSLQQETKVVL